MYEYKSDLVQDLGLLPTFKLTPTSKSSMKK